MTEAGTGNYMNIYPDGTVLAFSSDGTIDATKSAAPSEALATG